jgi:hypothetical protein
MTTPRGCPERRAGTCSDGDALDLRHPDARRTAARRIEAIICIPYRPYPSAQREPPCRICIRARVSRVAGLRRQIRRS